MAMPLLALQSCAIPCEDASWDIPQQCGYKMGSLDPATSLPYPGATRGDYCSNNLSPETFRNCADVLVLSSGTTTPSPSATPTATPTYTPTPTPAPVSSPSTSCVDASPLECEAWGVGACIYGGE